MAKYASASPWKRATLITLPLLALGLVWLYALASHAGGVMGKPGKSGTLSRRLASLNDESARLRRQTELLAGVDGDLRAATEEARSVSSVLATGDDAESLSPVIRRQAEAAGVLPRWIRADSFPLALVGNGDDVAAWRYSLFVDGTFDQLTGFINRLEQLDQPGGNDAAGTMPFFEIRDLNLTGKTPAAAGETQHRCTLLLHAYRPSGEWLDHD